QGGVHLQNLLGAKGGVAAYAGQAVLQDGEQRLVGIELCQRGRSHGVADAGQGRELRGQLVLAGEVGRPKEVVILEVVSAVGFLQSAEVLGLSLYYAECRR